MIPDIARLLDVSEHTWPPAHRWEQDGFVLRDGQGGGQRVSSATAAGPVTDDQINAAAAAMESMGQRAIFQLREGEEALDARLEALGYVVKDPTIGYVLPIEELTDKPIPRVTAFTLWEPLAIMKEIWASDGIGPERLAVMERAAHKTAVLSRWNEQPAGAAFVGLHENIVMVHAVVVRPHQRRQRVADWMMRRAAYWGQAHHATHIAVLCVAENAAANALYRALGFTPVGGYHYRVKPE